MQQATTALTECGICGTRYDGTNRLPVLGVCGHTFCLRCSLIFKQGNCTSCRYPASFKNAPVNFTLLETIQEEQGSENGFEIGYQIDNEFPYIHEITIDMDDTNDIENQEQPLIRDDRLLAPRNDFLLNLQTHPVVIPVRRSIWNVPASSPAPRGIMYWVGCIALTPIAIIVVLAAGYLIVNVLQFLIVMFKH